MKIQITADNKKKIYINESRELIGITDSRLHVFEISTFVGNELLHIDLRKYTPMTYGSLSAMINIIIKEINEGTYIKYKSLFYFDDMEMPLNYIDTLTWLNKGKLKDVTKIKMVYVAFGIKHQQQYQSSFPIHDTFADQFNLTNHIINRLAEQLSQEIRNKQLQE